MVVGGKTQLIGVYTVGWMEYVTKMRNFVTYILSVLQFVTSKNWIQFLYLYSIQKIAGTLLLLHEHEGFPGLLGSGELDHRTSSVGVVIMHINRKLNMWAT